MVQYHEIEISFSKRNVALLSAPNWLRPRSSGHRYSHNVEK
jgi:hypothetical protein